MSIPTILIWTPSGWELVIILVIIMMLFGVGKLPEVAKSLGGSVKAFKDATKQDALDVTPTTDDLASSDEREKEKVERS